MTSSMVRAEATVVREEIYLRSCTRFLLGSCGLPYSACVEFEEALSEAIGQTWFDFDTWGSLDEVHVLVAVTWGLEGEVIDVSATHLATHARLVRSYTRATFPKIDLRARDQRPPKSAELMLRVFLTPRHRHEVLLDLSEEYVEVRCRLGKWRADLWYCSQAVRSVPPPVWSRMRKSLHRFLLLIFRRKL